MGRGWPYSGWRCGHRGVWGGSTGHRVVFRKENGLRRLSIGLAGGREVKLAGRELQPGRVGHALQESGLWLVGHRKRLKKVRNEEVNCACFLN